MNPEDYEATLADYLGGELPAADAAAFEEHLAAHPEHRAEVEELRTTLAQLDRLQAAPREEPALRLTSAPAHADRGVRPLVLGLSKAAAILIFGVLVGRWTAPKPQAPPDTRPRSTVANAGDIHPGWYELAERLGAQHASFAGLFSASANALR